jgi:hypothetical protein
MTLFRLDASIRTDGSASREIADIVEGEWLAAYPAETIERRHIGVDVLPAGAWAQAIAASSVPAENRPAEQRAAVALAAALVDELAAADAINGGPHGCRIERVAVAHIYSCIGILTHDLPALREPAVEYFLSFW